jgi:hypothetical protein
MQEYEQAKILLFLFHVRWGPLNFVLKSAVNTSFLLKISHRLMRSYWNLSLNRRTSFRPAIGTLNQIVHRYSRTCLTRRESEFVVYAISFDLHYIFDMIETSVFA